jgi:hypothetical protein
VKEEGKERNREISTSDEEIGRLGVSWYVDTVVQYSRLRAEYLLYLHGLLSTVHPTREIWVDYPAI